MQYFKYGWWMVCAVLLSAQVSFAQLIKVESASFGRVSSHLLKPGLFLQPRNTEGYDQHTKTGMYYNCLRSSAVATKLSQSDSLSHFLNSLDNLKSDFQQYYQNRTGKFIVLLHRMPAWLSRSSDTTEVSSGFEAYEGYPPDSFAVWDSLVRGLTYKLKSWGIHPYYEVWNEPDTYHWQSTTDSFLMLYKHTAQAIDQVDTAARVGGPSVRKWPNGMGTDAFQVKGHRPDSLVDSCSLIKSLLDSTVAWGLPPDFISWKVYSSTLEEIPLAARYFDRLLQEKSIDSTTEVFITGWNVPDSLRETLKQPTLFAKALTYLSEVDTILDAHAVHAWQDGQYNDSLEFYRGTGMISDGGLQKPAWKSLVFGHMLRKGQYVPISTKDRVVAFGNIYKDTVRVIIANSLLTPFREAYIDLLYEHAMSEIDLIQAGYNTNEKIDSVFRGLKSPSGSQEIVDAFNDATETYALLDSIADLTRDFQLQILNNTNLTGYEYRLDSNHNNMIFKYDSFRSLGYNRQQAVNLVYFKQDLERKSIQMDNALYPFTLAPNEMVLLEFSDVQTGIQEQGQEEAGFRLYPNPADNQFTLAFEQPLVTPVRVDLFNLLGEKLYTLHREPDQPVRKISVPLRPLDLASGIFIVKVRKAGSIYTQKLFITPSPKN